MAGAYGRLVVGAVLHPDEIYTPIRGTTKVCPSNSGHTNEPNADFCSRCGTRMVVSVARSFIQPFIDYATGLKEDPLQLFQRWNSAHGNTLGFHTINSVFTAEDDIDRNGVALGYELAHIDGEGDASEPIPIALDWVDDFTSILQPILVSLGFDRKVNLYPSVYISI